MVGRAKKTCFRNLEYVHKLPSSHEPLHHTKGNFWRHKRTKHFRFLSRALCGAPWSWGLKEKEYEVVGTTDATTVVFLAAENIAPMAMSCLSSWAQPGHPGSPLMGWRPVYLHCSYVQLGNLGCHNLLYPTALVYDWLKLSRWVVVKNWVHCCLLMRCYRWRSRVFANFLSLKKFWWAHIWAILNAHIFWGIS